MKQIILGIHGLGNKPLEKLLKSWWLKSIREGLRKIGKDRLSLTFDMVYWADVLHPEPLDPDIKESNNLLFMDEPYRKGFIKERDEKPSLKVKLLQYVETQLDKVFLNDDLSIHFKKVTDKIIHRYFSELETYYNTECAALTDAECSAKDVIQKRLAKKLNKYKNYQILLIAHSMGSIVAFDVLSDLKMRNKIHTFTTIGSPLGLPVIVARIFAPQKLQNSRIKKPHVPDTIEKKWFNISDIKDKVALDHTIADDYAANKKGLIAEDVFVYNDYEIDGVPNPHKSYGYLRALETARIIDGFLKNKLKDKIFQRYNWFAKKISVKQK